MNHFRLIVRVAVLILAPLVLVDSGAKSQTAGRKTYRAYIGTYTAKAPSKGIYQFTFHPATGKMSAPELAAQTKDPSWIIVHPSGKFLYAANEHGKDSTISAFAIDAKSDKLTLLNMLPALGEDPCHLALDRTGKFLLTANYTSGNVAVFPILPDGKLGEHTALEKDAGTLGPNKERQEAPHAHWIREHGNTVFVADLGLDRVLVYAFDPLNAPLRPTPHGATKPTPPPTPIVQSAPTC